MTITRRATRAHVLTILSAVCALAASTATAQPVGTFRWQQLPYCNVLTLAVTQAGAIYRLEGFDDQCNGGRRATAVGVAVPNPDGTIGFGLTLVTNNGAASGGSPLHLDAAISLTSLGGTWRDSAGRTGAWTFAPAGAGGGSPRPAPNPAAPPVFTTGLSAGGSRVADVGVPAQAGDAANKGYVDLLRPRVSHVSQFGASPALTATCGTYMPITIVAPGPGRVIAVATVQMQIVHTAGTISQARVGLAGTATDCPDTAEELGDAPFFSVYNGHPASTYYPIGTMTRVFDVPAAGTHTYYLNARRALGGSMFVNAANITATWYPQ